MASIIEQLATEEIPRLRLGIAPAAGLAPDLELAEFVLAPFAEGERDEVARLIERGAEAVRLWASEGVAKAAARVNAPPPPLAEPPPIG
jgi:PTH1 family peptidyl-tRNA hydrolase